VCNRVCNLSFNLGFLCFSLGTSFVAALLGGYSVQIPFLLVKSAQGIIGQRDVRTALIYLSAYIRMIVDTVSVYTEGMDAVIIIIQSHLEFRC